MFDVMFGQISSVTDVFANDRGFHGLLGGLVFFAVIIAAKRAPVALRNSTAYWFAEAIITPTIAYLLAAIIMSAMKAMGMPNQGTDTSPIFSVPPILVAAYMFNRAMRLFLWQGMFAQGGVVVPRIVWNVLDILAYVLATYAILAFVYNQPMTGFVVSSGVVIGIVGLAFQPILGDVLAGIGLALERPFSTGDWVVLEDGSMGEVINMDWRATEIKTWNNTVLVVPNSKLAGSSIHNYDRLDGGYGFWFYVSVARIVPPALVRRLLLEAALKSESVLDEPSPVIYVSDVEKRPIQYMVFIYCDNYRKSFFTKDEILQNAWALFTKAGFNFAANPQDIDIRRGEHHVAGELEAAQMLKEVSLLEPLSDEERATLARDGIHHLFSYGDNIIVEDQAGGSMFIILSGMVLVQRTLSDGRVLDLAKLSTYDYFGEMSLLTGEARSASVIAHTECQVLEIPKHSLEPLFKTRPGLAEEIAAIMAERKVKSELMTAETKKVSVGDRLRDYSEAFAKSIRTFFTK